MNEQKLLVANLAIEERLDEMKQLRDSGWTFTRIGHQFCLSRSRVEQILKGRKSLSDSVRMSVLRRDQFSCQSRIVCKFKSRRPSCDLQVHHIDKNTRNNAMENLISVCMRCHKSLHLGVRAKKELKVNVKEEKKPKVKQKAEQIEYVFERQEGKCKIYSIRKTDSNLPKQSFTYSSKNRTFEPIQ